MAVNDVYRLSVDYTLATQVTSPVSGKTAFVPAVQGYTGGTAFAVAGDVASGVADSGNPVKIGFRAQSTAPTAVLAGQRINGWAGLNGQQAVMISDATGALIVIQGLGDAQTNGVNTIATSSRNSWYNGTQWDRSRSVVGAANTQGMGTAAVGMPLWSTTDTTQLRINTAASGDTALVAAVSGQTTRVYALRISVAGAVIVQIKTGSTVREVFNFAGNGGAVVLDLRDRPYYKTAANEALNINLSAAVQVDGQLEYVTSA